MSSSDDSSDESFHVEGEETDNYDTEEVDRLNQDKLAKLKCMRKKVNWNSEKERNDLLVRLYPLFKYWKGPLPNLRSIFRKNEIEHILSGSAMNWDVTSENRRGQRIIDFVVRTGYKDKPNVDKDGKPLSRRTTPVHHAARRWLINSDNVFRALFKIYDRFDVNCTDEGGFTHFHAACMSGLDYAVQRFLEFGQDPNCIDRVRRDSPLHLAARGEHKTVVELLLRNGANPNLGNATGKTPLHIICSTSVDDELLKLFFKINDENNRMVQIDARDDSGLTPLNVIIKYGLPNMIGLLLRNGADPNLANRDGSTPLHLICQQVVDEENFAKLFFKITDANRQTILIDAKDNFGRTPLQWAVANFMPDTIDVLLDRGADLSSFTFPSESQFIDRFRSRAYPIYPNYKLRLASGLLSVVERLESRGYELDRSDALVVMKLFADYDVLDTSADLDNSWFDDAKFVKKAKRIPFKASLSLYVLMQLPDDMATKLLHIKCSDYFKFSCENLEWCLSERFIKASAVHLNNMLSRKFLSRWSLDFFLTLTHYRLPILCCEIIIEQLRNKDLLHICLAAKSPSHDICKNNVIINSVESDNKRPVRAKKVPKKLQDYVC